MYRFLQRKGFKVSMQTFSRSQSQMELSTLKSVNKFLIIISDGNDKICHSLLRPGEFPAPVDITDTYLHIPIFPLTSLLSAFCFWRPTIPKCSTTFQAFLCTSSVHKSSFSASASSANPGYSCHRFSCKLGYQHPENNSVLSKH